MALNVNALSATKLKELKLGEYIAIRYARSQQEADDGASRIIYEQFPKGVAKAFSLVWASKFPPISKVTLTDLSRPKQTSITIIGGSVEVVHIILKWMLSCCDGTGVQQFPTYTDKPFFKYHIIKENADNLGVAVLSREMEQRLNEIAGKQIHSEDVRAMYLRLPAGHPMLKDIAAHVAELIWNRQLKAFGAYRTLREEIPQLDTDLNNVLEPRVKERREERARQMETRKAAEEVAEKCQKKIGTRKAPRKPIDEVAKQYLYVDRRQTSAEASNTSAQLTVPKDVLEPTVQHKTIRCSVARKAQQGRPTYLSLSLADAGIDKDDFTGDSFRPRAPRMEKPSKGNIDKGNTKLAKLKSHGATTSVTTTTKARGELLSTPGTVTPSTTRTISSSGSDKSGNVTPVTTVSSNPGSNIAARNKQPNATATKVLKPSLTISNAFSALNPKVHAK